MAPAVTLDRELDIIDIRQGEIPSNLRDDIKRGLQSRNNEERQIPTLVLYDEKGLKLFEEITYLEEYYLTNDEIEVLERYADQIAERIPHGAQVVELGSGNLRKIRILLEALSRANKIIDYYALDLSLSELQRTLSEIAHVTFDHVKCHGLYGTYDDGLEWLKGSQGSERPKCIMSMGSSIGNFDCESAASFLREFAQILGSKDMLIVGVDGCLERDKVFDAYNDPKGLTEEFYRNGLRNASKLLGSEIFKDENWDIIGIYNADKARHEAFISPRTDMAADGFSFKRGERIRLENSHKYSDSRQRCLWHDACLSLDASFVGSTGTYSVNMLSKEKYNFSLNPKIYAADPVPSISDWDQLWAVWDLVTRSMIPQDEMLSKPINLRNCCLFYLGHIPTFLDIHLTRATGNKPTEPSYYPAIFERGIDPDVENPELCHAHSEIPDEWPELEEILGFQERVRRRTKKLYDEESVHNNRKIARALWLGFEHEAMHLETLLYMLLQSDKTVPPTARPDFVALADKAHAQAVPKRWTKVPERKVLLGLADPESDDGPDRYFGWDNEKPVREARVHAFEAQTQPLTNGDYASYLSQTNMTGYPASWIVGEISNPQASKVDKDLLNGYASNLTESFLKGKAVRTVYGPIPLKLALDWPVMASYDELASCAGWMNGRIPTMEEARSIYEYVEEMSSTLSSNVCAKTIPAVNGHLSNDGVEETPPSDGPLTKASSAESSSTDFPDYNPLFADLRGCNVGFNAFHPLPVTNSDKLVGLGGMGGAWEWTSSVLEPYQGFKAMDLYPAYTADFFDGKHNIVLGGSWATHPRIAGRKSFINWYQRNYPYMWAGARLVRDIKA